MDNIEEFPKAPKTWEELESLKEYLTDCSVWFLRKKEDQDKYTSDMAHMSRDTMLGRIRKQMGSKKTALVPNEYPHTNILQNFPNALHLCLWNVDGPLDDNEIKKIVEEQYPKNQWFSMIRENAYMSIPEIWHCHVYLNQ